MSVLFLPFFVGVDGNGLAMAGAKLYFYQTGTTTPQNTYSDPSLTAPFVNANPVVADSNGLFPAIYLLASPNYKVILTTSAGVTVATRDPIPSNMLFADTTANMTAAINEAQGTNIASATSTPIGAATGNYVKVTGTTTITSFDTIQAGTRREVEFTGALTLTHNATSLILPGAANILTVAGDCATFISEGAGNWRCVKYMRSQALPNGGQLVSLETGAVATGTTVIPRDDTIPQNTEGDQYMSLAITPKSATSTLIITVVWIGASNAAVHAAAALFQDATANALAVGAMTQGTAGYAIPIIFRHVMTSGTTSATTFKVRAGGDAAGTTTFNGFGGARLYGGVMAASITIEERLP